MNQPQSNLGFLREQIGQLNSEFFEVYFSRLKVVREISFLKKQSTDFFPLWDPQREEEVFLEFQNKLKDLNDQGLLSFSLLIESQVSEYAAQGYPLWSKKDHLEIQSSDLLEQVNPLLLKVARPEAFLELKLHPKFKSYLLA